MERRIAVLVGVNEYEDADFENLKYAENDARAIYDVLVDPDIGDFSAEDIILLTGKSKTEVEENLEIVLNDARKDDLVFIYFAGHGKLDKTGDLCLAFRNTKINTLLSSSIHLGHIHRLVKQSDCRRIVIMIDSCFSGAVGQSFRGTGAPTDALEQISGQGIVTISASQQYERARERDDVGHGIFTYNLLKGLQEGEADQDGDGYISIDELYKYIYGKVRSETKGQQVPMKWGMDEKGDIIIAKSIKTLNAKRLEIERLSAEARNLDLTQDVQLDEALGLWRRALYLDPKNAAVALEIRKIEAEKNRRAESEAKEESLSISNVSEKSLLTRSVGGIIGLAICSYLWFWTPEIGLEPQATKLLGLLCFTVIYWAFGVLPDYAVAFIFALGLIVANLVKPDTALGGFASTTWFLTLGVLLLGGAITGSGLFYRASLRLIRLFPLKYNWQIVGLSFMGIIMMALIPQQSARTRIISQMVVNLSQSLGYKTPSKASTGLFVASFLGQGQLSFLFLTGSTTSLIAWGLLPWDVRAQFTWGYWFLAAFPIAFIVAAIVLISTMFLYRPEPGAEVSYKFVQTQLQLLGPLSRQEWIALGVLFFMVLGWLTVSWHGIDAAWISLISFCILTSTGILSWGILRKDMDWELLIYIGAILSMPAVLTQAKIDAWLLRLISPLISSFLNNLPLIVMIIVVISYTARLVLTSFLTVVILSVALFSYSPDLSISPWILTMIILVASEVWFFSFQVDWHTLAYSTTEGKGFSYRFMHRINLVYAFAYIVALIACIPYWRYLGLIG